MYMVWLVEMDSDGKVLEERELTGSRSEHAETAKALVNEITHVFSDWGAPELGIWREATHIVRVQARQLCGGPAIHAAVIEFN